MHNMSQQICLHSTLVTTLRQSIFLWPLVDVVGLSCAHLGDGHDALAKHSMNLVSRLPSCWITSRASFDDEIQFLTNLVSTLVSKRKLPGTIQKYTYTQKYRDYKRSTEARTNLQTVRDCEVHAGWVYQQDSSLVYMGRLLGKQLCSLLTQHFPDNNVQVPKPQLRVGHVTRSASAAKKNFRRPSGIKLLHVRLARKQIKQVSCLRSTHTPAATRTHTLLMSKWRREMQSAIQDTHTHTHRHTYATKLDSLWNCLLRVEDTQQTRRSVCKRRPGGCLNISMLDTRMPAHKDTSSTSQSCEHTLCLLCTCVFVMMMDSMQHFWVKNYVHTYTASSIVCKQTSLRIWRNQSSAISEIVGSIVASILCGTTQRWQAPRTAPRNWNKLCKRAQHADEILQT